MGSPGLTVLPGGLFCPHHGRHQTSQHHLGHLLILLLLTGKNGDNHPGPAVMFLPQPRRGAELEHGPLVVGVQ